MQGAALNQMTVPNMPFVDLLDMARRLGCARVELRNDLPNPVFDGLPPREAGNQAACAGVTLLALAEVGRFNLNPKAAIPLVTALAEQAAEAGCPAIVLIPHVGSAPIARSEQRALLVDALNTLRPVLQKAGVRGLIEPLGFAHSTLRFKQDVAEALGQKDPDFGLVHDTFHHHLAGETAMFPGLTDVVHVSSVTVPDVEPLDMTDAMRGLVGPGDRLGSMGQVRALANAGYAGPVSIEAFASDIHALAAPEQALRASLDFMTEQVAAVAA